MRNPASAETMLTGIGAAAAAMALATAMPVSAPDVSRPA